MRDVLLLERQEHSVKLAADSQKWLSHGCAHSLLELRGGLVKRGYKKSKWPLLNLRKERHTAEIHPGQKGGCDGAEMAVPLKT
jgi:hypothetical protein